MENKHGKFLFVLIVVNTVLFLSCSTMRNSGKLTNDFEIFFGSGFENDTTSLYIDSIMVFDNEVLNTEFSTGLTELQVLCKNGVLSTNKREGQSVVYSNHTRTLSYTININQMTVESEIDLKKGWFILFEKNKGSYDIVFRQFKQRPIFE